MGEGSLYAIDQEEEDDDVNKLQVGHQYTLKGQIEKYKVFLSSS